MTKQEKIKFWIRFALWTCFSLIIPVLFIGFRYSIFSQLSKLSFSGLGIIAIVIILVFLIVLIKYIQAYFIEWSMTKQVINGVLKVILPLGTILALLVGVKNNIDVFIQALGVVLVSEVIAIPLNPFPEAIYKKTKGKYESLIDYAVNKFKGGE
jgi:hypothetical protein